MKVVEGISGPCKIVYDQWYKKGTSQTDGVGNSRTTHKIFNRESAELSGIVPKLGSRGMENRVT